MPQMSLIFCQKLSVNILLNPARVPRVVVLQWPVTMAFQRIRMVQNSVLAAAALAMERMAININALNLLRDILQRNLEQLLFGMAMRLIYAIPTRVASQRHLLVRDECSTTPCTPAQHGPLPSATSWMLVRDECEPSLHAVRHRAPLSNMGCILPFTLLHRAATVVADLLPFSLHPCRGGQIHLRKAPNGPTQRGNLQSTSLQITTGYI